MADRSLVEKQLHTFRLPIIKCSGSWLGSGVLQPLQLICSPERKGGCRRPRSKTKLVRPNRISLSRMGDPGNAILLNGVLRTANREIGVPGFQPQVPKPTSEFRISSLFEKPRPPRKPIRQGFFSPTFFGPGLLALGGI